MKFMGNSLVKTKEVRNYPGKINSNQLPEVKDSKDELVSDPPTFVHRL